MEYLTKPTTKRAERLLESAKKVAHTFLTGAPLSVERYGVGEDNRLTFVYFNTERGGEEFFEGKKFDCLADAKSASIKIVTIRPETENE